MYDYSQSKSRLEETQNELEAVKKDRELTKIIFETRIETIKRDLLEKTRLIYAIQKNYQDIDKITKEQVENINDLRKFTKQYISENQPQIQQALNNEFDGMQNSIQCASGDKSKCLD